MTIKKALLGLQGVFLLAIGLPAAAQTDLTCDDITFSSAVTSKYADVASGCRDVVELDGERYAKFKAEIINAQGNRSTFRFKHADGSYGPTQTTVVDSSWRTQIDGRSYSMRQLNPGQEVNIYVPSDRWEANLGDTDGTMVTYYAVVMYDEEPASEPVAALPSTASPLPLMGMLGFGALFAAFLMRTFRRRQS